MTTTAAPVLSLPDRPVFGRHLAVHVVPGDGVALLGERTSTVLAGGLYERLASLLDGSRTADEIADLLESDYDAAQVYYAIAILAGDGHVVDAERTENGSTAFWDSLPATTALRRVEVASADGDTGAWASALQQYGFSICENRDDASDVVLQIVADYRAPGIAAWNRRALDEGRPWLLVRAGGTRAWIGPFFRPGDGPCWECLRHMLERNDVVRSFLERRLDTLPSVPSDVAPWTNATLIGLASGQLARVLSGDDSLNGSVVTLDTLTLEPHRHLVARRPQCPACGDPMLYGRQVLEPFELAPTPKQFTADGGHRSTSPEATFARWQHLIDPLTGVVSGLLRNTAADSALHVYSAGANPVFRYNDLTGLRAGLRRASSGKGFSEAQARASALAEALERYSASAHGDEPRVRATVGEMVDRGGIDPREVMMYSEAQYGARTDLPLDNDAVFDWVPSPVNSGTQLDWSPVWSLSEQRTRYLPTTWLYLGHRSPGLGVHCQADSNGCAAGNTREEALLQGLCELIERDAAGIWWYNRVSRPSLDIDDFDGSEWAAARSFYKKEGREVWLLDVTNDVRVPTIVAVSRFAGREEEEILVGLGTHLDVRMAAMRAVSEMNQMYTALDVMRRNAGGGVNTALASWLKEATVANQPYLVPSAGVTRRRVDYDVVSAPDIADDVRFICREIESLGMSVLVCDQTRPDVGLPVVKAIAPGLRHFRQRFAPGRLYDVPVKLGWRTTPIAEAGLNPIPFFL
jgi:ribosomal protein S12 methylthiotransferase accessory factor